MIDIKLLNAILEPGPNDPATSDGMNLCYARISVSTEFSEIAGIQGWAETLDHQGANPSSAAALANQVREEGPEFHSLGGNQYDADLIPNILCSEQETTYHYLHVFIFLITNDTPDYTHIGLPFSITSDDCGQCGSNFVASRATEKVKLSQAMRDESPVSMNGVGGKLFDQIDFWWTRDVSSNLVLREPVQRDGDWMLYRNLPVDIPFGAVLGLNGRPLKATSISVAVESLSLRRKMKCPRVHVGSPGGTGESAPKKFRFPGYPTFGTIVYQSRGRAFDDKVCQLVTSVTRQAPTDIFVHADRPIRLTFNSPKSQDFLNEGTADVWVRINSQ